MGQQFLLAFTSDTYIETNREGANHV